MIRRFAILLIFKGMETQFVYLFIKSINIRNLPLREIRIGDNQVVYGPQYIII